MAIYLQEMCARSFLGVMKNGLNATRIYVLNESVSQKRNGLFNKCWMGRTYSVWKKIRLHFAYNCSMLSFRGDKLNNCRQVEWQCVSKEFSSDTNVQGLSDDVLKKKTNEISESFTETLALLEDAKNSLGTVYFTEDMKDAEDMVNKTLNDYNSLLDKLSEKQRANVNRTIGLKMHEMKAQLDMIKEMCRE